MCFFIVQCIINSVLYILYYIIILNVVKVNPLEWISNKNMILLSIYIYMLYICMWQKRNQSCEKFIHVTMFKICIPFGLFNTHSGCCVSCKAILTLFYCQNRKIMGLCYTCIIILHKNSLIFFHSITKSFKNIFEILRFHHNTCSITNTQAAKEGTIQFQ